MDKPTEAQIKEFWELCGFKYEDVDLKDGGDIVTVLINPDGERTIIDIPINLDTLFQYAVLLTLEVLTKQGYCPAIMKLFQLWYDNLVTLSGDSSNVERANIALFWVCREVIYNGIGFQPTVTTTSEQLADDELY